MFSSIIIISFALAGTGNRTPLRFCVAGKPITADSMAFIARPVKTADLVSCNALGTKGLSYRADLAMQAGQVDLIIEAPSGFVVDRHVPWLETIAGFPSQPNGSFDVVEFAILLDGLYAEARLAETYAEPPKNPQHEKPAASVTNTPNKRAQRQMTLSRSPPPTSSPESGALPDAVTGAWPAEKTGLGGVVKAETARKPRENMAFHPAPDPINDAVLPNRSGRGRGKARLSKHALVEQVAPRAATRTLPSAAAGDLVVDRPASSPPTEQPAAPTEAAIAIGANLDVERC